MEVKSAAHGREWLLIVDPVLTRVLGRYESFREKEPEFSPSDLISLALLSRSENSRLKFYKNYYERAYAAVANGLQLTGKEALMSAVRKFSLASRDLSADWQACFTLRHKIQQLTDLNAHAPTSGIDSPIGQAAGVVQESTECLLDWYVAEVNHAATGVFKIDAAICALLGWDYGRRIDFESLLKKHNFPDRAQLKTFFRPTGLQDSYKAYEGPSSPAPVPPGST